MRKHVDRCTVKNLQSSDIEILGSNNQRIEHSLTMEALYIRKIDPELTTKDEYCSRELTIKGIFLPIFCIDINTHSEGNKKLCKFYLKK